MKGEGKARAGKPVDEFEDDRTGDTGDAEVTEAAAAAAMAGDERPGANRKIEDKAKEYVEAWDAQQDEIDAIMAEAKERCQPYKDEQKAIRKAGAEDGVPKKVQAALTTLRRAEVKKTKTMRNLDDDQKDNVIQIAKALGDDFVRLPLGEWAVSAPAKKSRRAA